MKLLSIQEAMLSTLEALGPGDPVSRLTEASYRMVCDTEPMVMCPLAGHEVARGIAGLVSRYILMPATDPGLWVPVPVPGIGEVPEGSINAHGAASQWSGGMFAFYFAERKPLTLDRLDEHLVVLAYHYKYCAAMGDFFAQVYRVDFLRKCARWSRRSGVHPIRLPLGRLLESLEYSARPGCRRCYEE